MSRAERRLAEDKALRDAALAVFQTDLRFIREDLSARGLGERIADRLGDATMDMLDDAADYAEANKGQVGAALAAAVLWFARAPLLDGLARLVGLEEEEAERSDGDDRSSND